MSSLSLQVSSRPLCPSDILIHLNAPRSIDSELVKDQLNDMRPSDVSNLLIGVSEMSDIQRNAMAFSLINGGSYFHDLGYDDDAHFCFQYVCLMSLILFQSCF